MSRENVLYFPESCQVLDIHKTFYVMLSEQHISSLQILFALFHINLLLSLVQYSTKKDYLISTPVCQCISYTSGPKLDEVCQIGSNKLQGVLPFQVQPPLFVLGFLPAAHSARPGPCGQPCPRADQLSPHTNTHRLGVIPRHDQSKPHRVLQITMLKRLYLWAGCFELLGFGFSCWIFGWLLFWVLVFEGFFLRGGICFVFVFFKEGAPCRKYFVVFLSHVF